MPCRRAFAIVGFVAVFTAYCSAQEPSGPPTLVNVLTEPESDTSTGKSVAKEEESGTLAASRRVQGSLQRPSDGYRHSDLDKAWVDYETAIRTAESAVRTALTKLFDAAAEKGDLDTAEKWQKAINVFEERGEVPTGKEMKAAAASIERDIATANSMLAKTYEALVKTLTTGKQIADAKKVRDEWKSLSRSEDAAPKEPRKENAGGGGVRQKIPANALAWNGHRYLVTRDKRTWHDAKKACEEAGGYLVIIETPEEQQALAIALANMGVDDGVWIGATDETQEGVWQWVDGSPVRFSNWRRGEPSGGGPNEHYAVLVPEWKWEWNDGIGDRATYFMCEWDGKTNLKPAKGPSSSREEGNTR